MKRRSSREINVFGMSFMDVLANTIGGLTFLLILTVMMAGAVGFLPPKITTETLPDAHDKQTYSIWLAARDGMGKYRWTLGQGTLPPGLSLDENSGRLAGEVQLADNDAVDKAYQFEVVCEARAADDAGTAEMDRRQFEIHVRRNLPATVSPLAIVTESLPDAYGGQPFPLALAVEGGQTPYAWQVAGKLPRGVKLDGTGRFTGSPTEPGTFRFRVLVRSADGQQAERDLALTVSQKHPAPVAPPPITVVTTRLAPAVALTQYDFFPAAEGGVPPYRWTITGDMPAWLTTNGGVSFLGTPQADEVGSHRLVLQVTDSKGAVAKSAEALTLKVLRPEGPEYRPLALRTLKLPEARLGQSYQMAFSAEGGTPPYRWSTTPLAPDLGIVFDAEQGLLAGEPQAAGSMPFTLTVRDSAAQPATLTRKLELRVRPAIRTVEMLTTSANEGRVGEEYELALAATGGHPPYHWTVVEGQLPSGLTFDEITGVISGTPQEAGSWSASFRVVDDEGTAAVGRLPLDFQILTSAGFSKLIAKTNEIPTLLKGEEFELVMACEGGRPPYRWKLLANPPQGVKTQGASLVGAPDSAGVYATMFRAEDSSGQSVDVQIPVTIRSLLPAWMVWTLAVLATFLLGAVLLLGRAYSARKPEALAINTQGLPNARASCDYHVQLSCIGGAAPYRWRLVGGQLPAGLQLTEDGRLIGCPLEGIGISETQNFPIEVEVTDSLGNAVRQAL